MPLSATIADSSEQVAEAQEALLEQRVSEQVEVLVPVEDRVLAAPVFVVLPVKWGLLEQCPHLPKAPLG